MTVKELIEKLQQYDQDAIILIEHEKETNTDHWCFGLHSVRQKNINKIDKHYNTYLTNKNGKLKGVILK